MNQRLWRHSLAAEGALSPFTGSLDKQVAQPSQVLTRDPCRAQTDRDRPDTQPALTDCGHLEKPPFFQLTILTSSTACVILTALWYGSSLGKFWKRQGSNLRCVPYKNLPFTTAQCCNSGSVRLPSAVPWVLGIQKTTAVSPPYPSALHFKAYVTQVLGHDRKKV